MVSLPIGALRNKMKYPKVTKDILDADYVQVTWSDINSDSSWKTLKDAMNSKVTTCISSGWLIRQDKEVHILVADVNFNDDGTLGDVGNITTMPTSNVLKVTKIPRV
jgi:aspartate-semialdehyde dehydrogenase